ncbi:MAG: hypothetical protein M9938_08390 [Solirubrobacterales bacterium]|nr:hypothetical protein [Solirubrobacterales bacterium]
MADEMKAAYLIHGTDRAKIDRARARLRQRAEAEAGAAALESFEPVEGRGSPDAEALAEAIGAMSLIPGRRYLLADGIEKWGKRQAGLVAEALLGAPPETTVVLIARGKVPGEIGSAVKKVGGESLGYRAPEGNELIGHLVTEARNRGFSLDPEAARLLIARLGERLTRLGNELDRLALWTEPGGEATAEDLAEMIRDETEVGPYELGDALVGGDRSRVLALAERLLASGERPGSLIYRPADAVRRAHRALTLIEEGRPPGEVERQLGVPPFVARRVIASVSGSSVEQLRSASIALSSLEIWLRGGAEYPEDLALDLTLVAAT